MESRSGGGSHRRSGHLEELCRRLAASSTLAELYIDRDYLGSRVIDALDKEGTEIVSRAWPLHNQGQFTKEAFEIDLDEMEIICPADQTEPIERLGRTIQFDSDACDNCRLRDECTRAQKGRGRSVTIAEDEPLQQKFREAEKTPQGRQNLREWIPVEHRLAHLGRRQGNRARYIGQRNNLFDVRGAASIQNLETAQRAAA